jgi:hypothetical protein
MAKRIFVGVNIRGTSVSNLAEIDSFFLIAKSIAVTTLLYQDVEILLTE